jgi:hypothetical protein
MLPIDHQVEAVPDGAAAVPPTVPSRPLIAIIPVG